MIMCVLLCYHVSIRIYYQQGGLFLVGPRDLQCETSLQEIMGGESCDLVRFDHGPLFQYQTTFSGFGELSFRWVQICISSPMR